MKNSVLITKIKQYPVGVIGFVLTIVFLVLISTRGGIVEEKSIEIEDLELQEKKMSVNIRNGDGLAEDVAEAKAIIESVQERLMDPENSLGNQRYFYSLESKAGIRMGNPNRDAFTPAGKNENYSISTYKISATGTLPEVLNFALMLRSAEYLSTIDSLSLSHAGQSLDSVSATITVKILGK